MRRLYLLPVMLLAGPALASQQVAASGRYVCPDGSLARITLAASGPVLAWRGREIALQRRASWSGYRYAGERVSLRGTGREGAKRLAIRDGDGPTLTCNAVPARAQPGIATGTATYLARIALPPGSVLTVELRDTARADAPAPVLARTLVRPDGNQVPLHWLLDYKPTVIGPRTPARPTLSARLNGPDGRLMFVSDTVIPLPQPQDGIHVETEIRMVPVGR